jgi:hypothetical protein
MPAPLFSGILSLFVKYCYYSSKLLYATFCCALVRLDFSHWAISQKYLAFNILPSPRPSPCKGEGRGEGKNLFFLLINLIPQALHGLLVLAPFFQHLHT